MKPRLFIGSSSENLELAYAVQEELERNVDATVWSQGVFELSQTAMASLIDVVGDSDFGLFILAPNDVTNVRDKDKRTVRDNVIFELGLFIGRLGPERSFMIVPRGVEDLHLPTDLLGLAPAEYDPNRQDGNIRAALGPACNRIRKAIAKHGVIHTTDVAVTIASDRPPPAGPVEDPGDIKAILQSWMGNRSTGANTSVMRFAEVDITLGLKAGSAEAFLEDVAQQWDYEVAHKGKETILFQERKRSSVSYF